MSCLSDRDIIVSCRRLSMIEPFNVQAVQPASYELTFDGSLVYKAKEQEFDDMCYVVKDRAFKWMSDTDNPLDSTVWEEAEHDLTTGGVLIFPGSFYIASSREVLRIPDTLMARFEGKSTLGRAGLMVHITAGYIDPGFEGNLTLEIANVAPWPIILQDGDKIGQLSFHMMHVPPAKPYGMAGNHYQGQRGPTLPR